MRSEIISSIFSDHNGMKLEINCKKKAENKHNHLEIKQHTTKQVGQRRNKNSKDIKYNISINLGVQNKSNIKR